MNMRPSSIRGFTLVELMVVIVIMAIMASLVLMNTGGVDQRKAMQSRTVFLMDMKKIQREATDQSRILALNVQSETDVSPFRYTVVEYQNPTVQQIKSSRLDKKQIWKEWAEFKPKELPEEVSFTVKSLDYQFQNAANTELISNDAPQLVWLGNGEAKPVRIQFYFQQKPIGQEIEIDHLGKIHEEK